MQKNPWVNDQKSQLIQSNIFGRNQILAEKYKKLYTAKFKKESYNDKLIDDFELLGRVSEENLELEKQCCKYKIEAKFGDIIGKDNLENRIKMLQEMEEIVKLTMRGYEQGLSEREREEEQRQWIGMNSNVYVYIQYQYRMMLFQLLQELGQNNQKMVKLENGDQIMNEGRCKMQEIDKQKFEIEQQLEEYMEMNELFKN